MLGIEKNKETNVNEKIGQTPTGIGKFFVRKRDLGCNLSIYIPITSYI